MPVQHTDFFEGLDRAGRRVCTLHARSPPAWIFEDNVARTLALEEHGWHIYAREISRNSNVETLTLTKHGLMPVQLCIASERGVCFITWHHHCTGPRHDATPGRSMCCCLCGKVVG